MQTIDGRTQPLREVLEKQKYQIDYYQREYNWEAKHIEELIADLETKFFSYYEEGHERVEVENYGPYFLGSIVISDKQGKKFIIDGQQRLTSLTLILINLHHLLKKQGAEDNVSNLIYSEKFQ